MHVICLRMACEASCIVLAVITVILKSIYLCNVHTNTHTLSQFVYTCVSIYIIIFPDELCGQNRHECACMCLLSVALV